MDKTRSTLRPALLLAVITPFLTELLSGSQSVIHFFFPPAFLFLLLVYGLPILLIRDYWIRSGAGLPGLLLLGLAYGFYNEGVVAKTLLRSEHVPLGVFNNYTIGGINWAWAALIVPWHAFQAVLAPIIIVSWFYPDFSTRPWMSRKLFASGIIVSLLVGSFAFFVAIKPSAPPVYLLAFLAIIVGLGILGRCVPSKPTFLNLIGPPEWRVLVLGFCFYPTFILSLCLMAAMHSPTFLILITSTFWLALWFRLISRHGLNLTNLTIFCLSECLSAASITALIMAAHGNIPGASADSILAILFVIGLQRVCRRGLTDLK